MNIKTILSVTPAVIFAWKQVWRYKKSYPVILFLINLLLGILPVVLIWVTQQMLNSVTNIFLEKETPYEAFFLFLLLIVLMIGMYAIQHIGNLNDQKTSFVLGKHIQHEILNKINNIPYLTFETPKIYDKIQRIRKNQNTMSSLVKYSLDLFKSTITVFSVLGYLLSIHWAFLIFLSIGIIPLVIIQLFFGYKKYQLNIFLTPFGRKEGYLSQLLTNRRSLKEVRLYGLNQILQKRWGEYYDKTKNTQYNLAKKSTFWTFMAEVVVTLTYALSGLFAIYLIYIDKIKVGSFVAVLQSVENIQESLENISSRISDIYETSFYVNEYREFMGTKEVVEPNTTRMKKINKIDSIKLRNISFCYPNVLHPTLKRINLDIPIGKNITIIGENGSGKTTLTKCITGLYDITEGEIFVNQMPIKNIDVMSYQERISVLFQDFERYMFNVKDNVGFGDIANIRNERRIKEMAVLTGLHESIERMPKQYDTELGNMFEAGSQLSGGQWQKLALSRALFRDSDLIVLDEPTSNLDPLSEVNILEHLYQHSGKRSIICITHRIGPALLSDEILVMDKGEIVERGTHEDLIKDKGFYFKLFKAQEKWYGKGDDLSDGVYHYHP